MLVEAASGFAASGAKSCLCREMARSEGNRRAYDAAMHTVRSASSARRFLAECGVLALLGCGVLVGCGASASDVTGPAPDASARAPGAGEAVIYAGGVVHTLDPARPRATGVRIENGRITHVFNGDTPADLSGRRVDLHGAALLPGLVDAHLHLRSLGTAAREVDLRGTTSPDEVAARVREAAAKAPPGAWIRGRGWDQNDWEKKEFPAHAPLDAAAPGNPVWLSRVDGHAVWVNARALALAGVDATTKSPSGGEILHDASGAPSGVLVDNAVDLVESKLPPSSPAEVRADLERGMDLCRRAGLTAVHDMGTEPETLAQLRVLEKEGKVTLRVYAYLGGAWSRIEPLLAEPPDREGLVQVLGVKLFADGALGSRGAALFAPYSDRPETSGLFVTPEEELRRRAAIAHRAGYDVTIHAIGDKGNRVAIDALTAAQGDDRSHRHRIEHAQVLAPEDIPRFAKLGIIASMQPTHCTSDMPWAEARVGAERIKGAYAWRTLQSAGATIIFGSDAPVEGENPWLGIYAAVTRMDAEGKPAGGWRAQEKLTALEAITAFSRTPNEVARVKDLGVIKEGALADLTIVAEDPLTVAPDKLRTMRTVKTIVAGKEVYEGPTP